MLRKQATFRGRPILRILAARATARKDNGQACAFRDLMEMKIRGSGKDADADLCPFCVEWI
eukprot:3065644-Pyramimonas_sp.AAC.1